MENIPSRLTGKPSWLITRLSTHAHRLSTDAFAQAGARGYHFRILAALDEFGQASQADIGRRTDMDRSDVVAALNELADHGFIERSLDPDDRRRNLVSITKAGERQLSQLDQDLDAAQDELLEPLSKQERRDLTALLTRLLEHHR